MHLYFGAIAAELGAPQKSDQGYREKAAPQQGTYWAGKSQSRWQREEVVRCPKSETGWSSLVPQPWTPGSWKTNFCSIPGCGPGGNVLAPLLPTASLDLASVTGEIPSTDILWQRDTHVPTLFAGWQLVVPQAGEPKASPLPLLYFGSGCLMP